MKWGVQNIVTTDNKNFGTIRLIMLSYWFIGFEKQKLFSWTFSVLRTTSTFLLRILRVLEIYTCQNNYKKKKELKMDGAGANMCKAVNIDGVAVKASFISRVCVGGK